MQGARREVRRHSGDAHAGAKHLRLRLHLRQMPAGGHVSTPSARKVAPHRCRQFHPDVSCGESMHGRCSRCRLLCA